MEIKAHCLPSADHQLFQSSLAEEILLPSGHNIVLNVYLLIRLRRSSEYSISFGTFVGISPDTEL